MEDTIRKTVDRAITELEDLINRYENVRSETEFAKRQRDIIKYYADTPEYKIKMQELERDIEAKRNEYKERFIKVVTGIAQYILRHDANGVSVKFLHEQLVKLHEYGMRIKNPDLKREFDDAINNPYPDNPVKNRKGSDRLLDILNAYTDDLVPQDDEPDPFGKEPKPPVYDPEPNKPHRTLDLDYLINYICGGEVTSDFKWYDKIIYNADKAKLWNWKTRKERTFLDKPMKLVRTVLGVPIVGGSKLFSKILKSRGHVKERIDFMLERIQSLTPEELEFIRDNLTGNIDKSKFGVLPKVVRNALQDRLDAYNLEIMDNNNLLLDKMYRKLIDDFNRCTEINEELKDPSLTSDRKVALEHEKALLSGSFYDQIDAIEKLYRETDDLVNASGSHGKRENAEYRMANLVGGRNSSTKDHREERNLLGDVGLLKMHAKDGYDFARLYLYKQKLFIENTRQKRTLKNRFGYANVGAYQFSPFVETIDYTPYEYGKDVLLTVTTVMATLNLIGQIKQLAAYKDLVTNYNNLVTDYNALATDYLNLHNWATQYQMHVNSLLNALNNGGATAAKELENILRTLPGGIQGTIEYAMMQADAAAVTSFLKSQGGHYSSLDQFLHSTTSSLTQSAENVIQNMQGASLSAQLQAYTAEIDKMNKAFTSMMAPLKAGNVAYANTWQMFDQTALLSLFNNMQNANPGAFQQVIQDITIAANKIVSMPGMPSAVIKAANTVIAGKGNLIPAIATLAGVGILDTLSPKTRKLLSNQGDLTEGLMEKFDEVHIDMHEAAKRAYEIAKDEYERNGYYTRLGQKIEAMPTLIEFERDKAKEEIAERGLANDRI